MKAPRSESLVLGQEACRQFQGAHATVARGTCIRESRALHAWFGRRRPCEQWIAAALLHVQPAGCVACECTGSCCSSAKELTQVSSVFGLVLSGEVPVTVQLLRLPAQMRMRFVTLTREALENGRGAFDACAFLARRSKHASVKDIIFKLQEPVGKALRAPFLDQFREEGPQPASGGVLNGHNGTGGEGKKKKLNGCTVDFICCLCLRCLSAAEPWKAKEVVGIPQGARPCLFAWHGPLTCTAGRAAWEAKVPITHRSLFIQACEDLDSLRVTHVKQDQRSVRFKAARGFVHWKCVLTACQCRC